MMPDTQRRGSTVLVAMSGGVDSSVAAALLVEAGHRVIGVTIKTFCYTHAPTNGRTCCGLDGIIDARRVAGMLDIPHYVFDMEESFTNAVIDDFVNEYAAGRTPNPCVRCNSNTKIPHLLARGRMLGADLVATGHYARSVMIDGHAAVLRGVDAAKDQTYFLWAVPRDVIPSLVFPVGSFTKAGVRERARALGLITADKPESQEICFVPHGDYAQFLAERLGEEHVALAGGNIVDADGTVLGRHDGYARYTVGQRRGLGGGFDRRMYVLGVRAERNEIVVGTDDELRRSDVVLGDLNWIADPPVPGARVNVQLRHRAWPVVAHVVSCDGDTMSLALTRAERAVTPGQSGAVYRGERLLGGGRIR